MLERDAAQSVADILAAHFTYTPDPQWTDNWPARQEVEAQLSSGNFCDDCDGFAFAAVYLLADLGIKARVLLGWTEPPQSGYHAVCETESGYVLDNRFPGRVLTWDDQPKFTKDRMSGFFEFGDDQQGKWRQAR